MRTGNGLITLLSTAALLLTACTEESPQGYWEENPSTGSTPSGGTGNPHAGMNMGMQNTGTPSAPGALVGKVVETMESDTGTYTYVKLEMPNGDTEWAAVPATAVEAGRFVAIANPQKMQNFPTKTKMGTFDELILGSGLSVLDSATGAHVASGGVDASNPHGGATGPSLEVQPGEIQAPAGATKIADVFAQAAALAGQPVTIHGKITKATPLRGGVWTHVQDGSGDPAAGTHDLTVILGTVPELGSIVTIQGTLQIGHEMAMGSAAQQPVLNTATIQGQ